MGPAEITHPSKTPKTENTSIFLCARLEKSINPQATIDLGGIAKGYIADKLVECLTESGARHCMVNLGGNVAGHKICQSQKLYKVYKSDNIYSDVIPIGADNKQNQ